LEQARVLVEATGVNTSKMGYAEILSAATKVDFLAHRVAWWFGLELKMLLSEVLGGQK
jgi:hypothetical protein